MRVPISAWVLLAWPGGCTDEVPARPDAERSAEPAPTVPGARPAAAWKILAPSPLELEQAVVDAGIAESLAPLVGPTPPEVPPESRDRVAFRNGIVFAQALLVARTAEKAELVARLRVLREGMVALGSGAGLVASMDKAIDGVDNEVMSRDELRLEIDGYVRNSVPEEGWAPGDTTGPLLQAGAWVEGIHLVARAVVAKGDPSAADELLRHPEVPEFFLGYVRSREGEERAAWMARKLAETLEELRAIAAKPTLDLADAQAIADATGGLLQLL